MPYVLLISVIVGVTNVIPFFGPFIGAVPSAFLILLVDPMKCLYFLIFILVLQQFDGNILGPKILGDSTGLPSFWVLLSLFCIPFPHTDFLAKDIIHLIFISGISFTDHDLPTASLQLFFTATYGQFFGYIPQKRKL